MDDYLYMDEWLTPAQVKEVRAKVLEIYGLQELVPVGQEIVPFDGE